MKNEKYLIIIYNVILIYFKVLMKHLNVEKKINIIEMTLFNNYLNE